MPRNEKLSQNSVISEIHSYLSELEAHIKNELFPEAILSSEKLNVALKSLSQTDFETYKSDLQEIMIKHQSLIEGVGRTRKDAIEGLSNNMKAKKATDKYREVNQGE